MFASESRRKAVQQRPESDEKRDRYSANDQADAYDRGSTQRLSDLRKSANCL